MKRLASLALLAAVTAAQAESQPLVVHEWGTFTSLQDENGATVSGVNVDDEPVPAFVHRLNNLPIFHATALPATWSQGAPRCHPDVTLRLETPVLYFYPPTGWAGGPFDVRATFAGGWLTEFFPFATVEGITDSMDITTDTRGGLVWKGVRLDASGKSLQQTQSHVWLAPRHVNAAVVANGAGEAEKYLFYRGVGHLDAPIVIQARAGGFDIAVRDGDSQLSALPRMWLVEVSPNGRVRHQTLNPSGKTMFATAFPPSGSGKSSLGALQREIAAALVAQGLFADEAAAMLDTWRLSYFESEGLRVFFLLPRAWTDARLPLSISTPAEITRVMVGRVELVSDHQRAMLTKLLDMPAESVPLQPIYFEDHAILRAGLRFDRPLSELYRESGRDVPESLQAYESMGRFRDALLTHELKTDDIDRRAKIQHIMRAYSACVVDSAG